MTKDDLNEIWLGLYKAIADVATPQPPPLFPLSESTIFLALNKFHLFGTWEGGGGQNIFIEK